MRVLAGQFKGRHLTRPKVAGVRPMTGKTLGALFDVLGPVDDLVWLDAYAGAGTVGIEALSRGAERVVAIEKLPAAVNAIRSNAKLLNLGDRYQLIELPVERWLRLKPLPQFDIISADPPFALIDEVMLGRLAAVLKPKGVMVVSHTSLIAAPELRGLELIKTQRHGDSSLSFYRRGKLAS